MTFAPLVRKAIRRARRAAHRALLAARLVRLKILNRFGRDPITRPGGPVVSLTTFGKRIETVHLAIESIARGLARPSRLILWIDNLELLQHLPPGLRRLQQRGLEIEWCQDFGPHKKYYPYLKSLQEICVPLVTADDDLIYPRTWLKRLNEEYASFPKAVNCYRARIIGFDDKGFTRYEDWPFTTSTEPSFRHFAGSGAGAIFPIGLQQALKNHAAEFLLCCPKADDIWLHTQALRAGYRVRQIDARQFRLFEIPGTQQTALHHGNLAGGGNDRQIKATYTDSDISILLAADQDVISLAQSTPRSSPVIEW
jgi:hypothetical protein